ncbi:MAG: hypothetical protein GX783_14375 [Clostridiales bacterium]|nr:hypothetical protein [Clostridiales bacterium]
MEVNHCESALIEICKSFLEHLYDLRQGNLISEEEYERHSEKKLMFLNRIKAIK